MKKDKVVKKISASHKITSYGFTLIETLIVIAIISVFSIGAMASTGFIQDYQMNQIAKDIKYFINTTQQEAILANINYEITSTSTVRANYLSQFVYSKEVKRYRLPQHIEIGIGTQRDWVSEERPLPNTNSIRFSSDLSPNKTGTLRIRDKNTGRLFELAVRPITGYVAIKEIS